MRVICESACAFIIMTGALFGKTEASSLSGNSFAVRGVRVFDGRKVIPRANLIVREGRIALVGADASIPGDLPVIDGAGKTFLPGLIDSHVHVFPGAQADALRFGVTTELDMFDVSREFEKWKAQRESLARTTEADTWGAGIGATVEGGAPLQMAPPEMAKTIPTVTSAAEAKKFVDARVAEGSDYIKVFIEDLSEYGGKKHLPTLSVEEVSAVIKAAHDDGRMAIVHVQAESAAREAIECGADALAHTFPDRVADPSFITLAKAHHIFLETTVDVWAGASGIGLAQKLAADPRVAPWLSQAQKQSLLMADKDVQPKFFPNALATIEALHKAGIPIVAGTDAPNEATAHGVSLHEELQVLMQAKFTPHEALEAVTALPAKIFRLGDRGQIAAGYRADLLLVDGDPTQNIGETLSISRIWKNGYEINRAVPTETPKRDPKQD